MARTQEQSGFTVVEVLLVLILVAILGFTGYYVWHSQQAADNTLNSTNKTSKSSAGSAADAGLSFSAKPTFYDCMDAYGKDTVYNGTDYQPAHPAQHSWDTKTGVCTLDGKSYTLPTTFTDDNIRDTKGMHFTTSEANYLRTVGKKNFDACSGSPDMFGTINMYGESDGKYLYYDVACDSGHREVAVLQGSDWKVVYSGQDIIACDTITKYDIPHALFDADNADGSKAQCFQGPAGSGPVVDISSLKS